MLRSDFLWLARNGQNKQWALPVSQEYATQYSYDPNGNILTLQRYGPQAAPYVPLMDNFTYFYPTGPTITLNNRLLAITDATWPMANAYQHDITNLSNYTYDGIGNLIYDSEEGVTINWNPDGKVRTVRKNIVGNTVNGPQASLRTDYQYNPAGQRIRKVTRDKSAATINPVTGTSWSGPEGPYEPALRRNKVTYYVRDANEQVIAIYEEQVFGHDEGQGNFAGTGDADGDLIADWMDNAPAVPNPTQDDFDHDGIADACDWCITIPNGPETEVALPQNGLPPICLPGGCTFPGDGFFGGRNLRLAEWPIYGTGAHGRFATAKPKNLARVAPQGLPASVPETFTRILKQKEYELSDHLGNVRVTFSDVKQLTGAPNAPPYKVDLQTYANYYPFGMMQPMRSYPDPGAAAPGPGAGTTYRYGYNGKEMDNEWYGDAGTGLSGVGNSYDYGFRIYNPRYARFLSVDPLTDEYPGWSPYPFAMNRPIDGIDLDGAEFLSANSITTIVMDNGQLGAILNEPRTKEITPFLYEAYKTSIRTMLARHPDYPNDSHWTAKIIFNNQSYNQQSKKTKRKFSQQISSWEYPIVMTRGEYAIVGTLSLTYEVLNTMQTMQYIQDAGVLLSHLTATQTVISEVSKAYAESGEATWPSSLKTYNGIVDLANFILDGGLPANASSEHIANIREVGNKIINAYNEKVKKAQKAAQTPPTSSTGQGVAPQTQESQVAPADAVSQDGLKQRQAATDALRKQEDIRNVGKTLNKDPETIKQSP